MTKQDTSILIVSAAGPPKSSPESLQVSRYLKYLMLQETFSITLVTEKLPYKNFGWRTLEPEYEYLLQQVDQLIELPVYYHRWVHGLLKRINPGLFFRPDNESLFSRFPANVFRSLKIYPNVIYSRSTPFSSAVLAKKIRDRLGVPWLMHLSDPWVESPHFNPPKQYHNYHKALEFECFNKADLISFTTVETKKLYALKYPQFDSKYLVLPNVYDDDKMRVLLTPDTGPIRIVHTGNFYGQGRRPGLILKHLKHLEAQYPDLHRRLTVVFTGFLSEDAKAELKEFNCRSARYLGAIRLSEVLKLQHNADVLLLIDWELHPEKAVFQLSKSVDYLAAKRPILAITTKYSAIYKMVQGRYGVCFEHRDQLGLSSVLKDLAVNGRNAEIFSGLHDLGNQYSANKNASILSDILLSMASDNKIS